MKFLPAIFFVASGVIALALLLWATIDLLFGPRELTYLTALLLWLGTGLPLVIATGCATASCSAQGRCLVWLP